MVIIPFQQILESSIKKVVYAEMRNRGVLVSYSVLCTYVIVWRHGVSEFIALPQRRNTGTQGYEQLMTDRKIEEAPLCLPPRVLAGPEVGLHPRDEEDLAVVDVGVHQGQRLLLFRSDEQFNQDQIQSVDEGRSYHSARIKEAK